MSGIVRDRADSMTAGRWIDRKLPLAYLIDTTDAEIEGLVPVDELAYVAVGQPARFIPLDLTRPALDARVMEIAEVDEREFTVPYLASVYGGDVPVRKDDKGRLRPDVSVYRVRLQVKQTDSPVEQAVAGHVQIQGQSSSLVRRVWDRTIAVLIRESGF